MGAKISSFASLIEPEPLPLIVVAQMEPLAAQSGGTLSKTRITLRFIRATDGTVTYPNFQAIFAISSLPPFA